MRKHVSLTTFFGGIMQYVLMDLDGTLTNSEKGIVRSFDYALKHFGIETDDLSKLHKYIGPPLLESFMEDYGFPREKAQEAVEKYRERYNVTGLFENEVYEGMEEALKKLNEAGKKLIVATSKPEDLAKRITDHFGLSKYFIDICGASADDVRSKKTDVMKYALEKNNVTDLSEAVMVGDRLFDIEGAHACGLKCVAVLYGFGNEKEFAEYNADYVAKTPEDMADIIIGL